MNAMITNCPNIIEMVKIYPIIDSTLGPVKNPSNIFVIIYNSNYENMLTINVTIYIDITKS